MHKIILWISFLVIITGLVSCKTTKQTQGANPTQEYESQSAEPTQPVFQDAGEGKWLTRGITYPLKAKPSLDTEHDEAPGYVSGLSENKTCIIGGQKYTFIKDALIVFYPNGSLAFSSLAENHQVTVGENEYTFLSGELGTARIIFDTNGNVLGGSLAKETTVDIGDVSYTFGVSQEIGDMMMFYPSGKVHTGTLASDHDVIIKGKTYTFGGQDMLYFHESGAVKWGYLKGGGEYEGPDYLKDK